MDAVGEILRPSAARLLESMRDIGYSFESALADIVDNSISATATDIRIVNDLDTDGHPYLAIADNGRGMRADELTAAMRHGSRSPREVREAGDLGRFGLGMKTASFSQCRRLTVASRVNGAWEARCWDLDHVVKHDEWLLQVLDQEAIAGLPALDSLSGDGTLILWQKLDRLDALGPHPDQVYEALNAMFGSARRHLALTFHRFIAPESDATKPVAISINGASLDGLDPFARLMRPQSDAHEVEVIHMDRGEIVVQAFTLPHHERLSAAQMRELELGSSLSETQGLYVYRAGRLISSGSWLGMARKAELTKLLRVRVDVPTSLDTEWSVDVRKSRVQPPAAVRERLKPLALRMTDRARRPYTFRGRRQASGPGLPLWVKTEKRGKVFYEISREHPLVRHAGGDNPNANVEALLLAIEATLPLDALFADISATPQEMGQETTSPEELEQLVAAFVEAVAPASDTLSAALAESILQTPVFARSPTARAVLERLRRIEG